MKQRMNKLQKRRISTHALQVLHTLHLQSATSLNDKKFAPKSVAFTPSARLQDLFNRYEAESDSDSDTSSIDYDILAGVDFSHGPGSFYKSLRHMWSMYVLNGEEHGDDHGDGTDDEDFDLDIDYDAMLAGDFNDQQEQPTNMCTIKQHSSTADFRRYTSSKKETRSDNSALQLAASTPSRNLKQQLEETLTAGSSDRLITRL